MFDLIIFDVCFLGRDVGTGPTGTRPTGTRPTGTGPTGPDWSDIRGAEASHHGEGNKLQCFINKKIGNHIIVEGGV